MKTRPLLISFLASVFFFTGCSSAKKVRELQDMLPQASLSLAETQDFLPSVTNEMTAKRDTLTIRDGDRTILIMKAIKDEEGEMVAHDIIDAAVVTSRFRNVAERHGKVDIQFQIIVPQQMRDSDWQLRFQPFMHILTDTVALDKVIITGADYRKAQLKGYQQYEKFLSSIVTDSTRFVNIDLLEIFLQRNIPQLYAFKSDSTTVSDEQFASVYGVTEQDAIDHYTNRIAKNLNRGRMARREKMYRKYVKVPISNEGIRLDTVLVSSDGDFIYNYTQTILTKPKLRKADVILTGDIYQEDRRIYRIPETDPLTFYISSLSSFVDNRERYLTRVIERRVEENTACYIEFASASHHVDELLGNNPSEMSRIKDNLATLMQNREFDLDSIIITSSASPEGAVSYNRKLSERRSEAISEYYSQWMTHYQDSLSAERGLLIDEDGNISLDERHEVPLHGRSDGENWRMLDRLVEQDTLLTDIDRKSYFRHSKIADADHREKAMQKEPYYRHIRTSLYPRLRSVRFDFYLHRKGMVKDTVHTTVLDSTYMRGVQAIRDRDYETAITLLRPYNDYNTAISYLSMDYNASAMQILEKIEKTAQVNYMLAVLYSRNGDDRTAVEYYLKSCSQDPSYVHRGNLDPEISVLIKRYGLNSRPGRSSDDNLAIN